MNWKHVRTQEQQRCSSRGCSIPGGCWHFRKTWRQDRQSPWVESVYCERCAHGSRCAPGPLTLGPGILSLLAGMSFIAAPLVWRAHWAAYPGLFLLLFAFVAIAMTRLYFWRPWGKRSPLRLPRFKHAAAAS